MKTQIFGNIRVDAISELEQWVVDPAWLLRGATREAVAEHARWLGPRLVEAGSHNLILSSHAYLIRTPHHTLLFDTCCGNDKERGDVFPFHRLKSPFLQNLASAGVSPEQVDYVMCSHLHVDHVGWNTRLTNGEWVPTFPNARYLFSRGEVNWWHEAAASGGGSAYSRAAFQDSVLPVLQREQAILVDDDHCLENALPDEIRYLPLHGHTAHHCGLYLRSGSSDAILSGDAIHHPIQFARPDWIQAGFDPQAARRVIENLVARCIDTDTKLLTAHFPAPTAGRVIQRGNEPRFEFEQD